MLQEYIPGDEDSNWMFNGYFDINSTCLMGVTGRKLRQFPAYAGVTSLGICVQNAFVTQMTLAFMKSISYRGVVDMGYRYDARDGKYKVYDINPRIGATFRLFVDTEEGDVARALYLDMTRQVVPIGAIREGRKWMVEDADLISSLRYHWDKRLTIGEWLRSLSGVQEGALFARDDLLPICGRVLSYLRRAVARTPKQRYSRAEPANASAEKVQPGHRRTV